MYKKFFVFLQKGFRITVHKADIQLGVNFNQSIREVIYNQVVGQQVFL